MRTTILYCYIVIIALVIALPANADDRYYVGVGVDSCGTWTKDRSKDEYGFLINAAWVQGYLSALNVWTVIGGKNDVLHDINANALVAWVDKYCQEHPLDTIVKAATELALELDRRSRPGGTNTVQPKQ